MFKSLRLYFAMLAFIAFGSTSWAQNLVMNGSAENFDSITNRPNNWEIVSGDWKSALPAGQADSCYEGGYLFFEGGDMEGIIQQDVDVSAYATAIDAAGMNFSFAGYVQSFPQGPGSTDQTRIIVTCLNNTKTTVLHTFDSDTMCSMAMWTRVGTIFTAPAGTKYVRIKLIATKRAGLANDGLFDAISLYATPVGVAQVAQASDIQLYPNPTTDVLHITNAAGNTLTLTDAIGRVWVKNTIPDNNFELTTKQLPTGLYTARIAQVATGVTKTISVVKQ